MLTSLSKLSQPLILFFLIAPDIKYKKHAIKPLRIQSLTWRLLRLQIVIWLDIIPSKMTFFVAITINHFRNVFLTTFVIILVQ